MGNLSTTFTYLQYTGTNTVKIAIYKDSDPDTEIPAQYQAGPFTNHIFYFTGLDRVAYKVKRFEVDNADHTHILADYGVFYVFTPNNQKFEYKAPAEWIAGITVMPDGATVYPFGAASFTNPDWAGWEVMQFNSFGVIYMRGRDYNYDAVTGTLTKINDNDVFEQNVAYQLLFAPKIGNADSDSGGSADFSDKLYIRDNHTLTPTDAGKDIAVKGTASYIEVTLPKLSEVIAGKRFYVRMPPGNTVRCARFKTQLADIIDFGKGNRTAMFLYPSESFEFYKDADDTDPANLTSVWCIRNAQGNHLIVGETISDESDATHVINKVEKNGTDYDANVYARLYEDFILKLPASQVVPYNQWSSGTNRYKYSLKDTITNKFHIPDTTGMFERQSSAARAANSFEANAMADHEHLMPIGSLAESGTAPYGNFALAQNGGQYYGKGNHKWDLTSKPFIPASPGGWKQQDASSDTHPDNVANNRWVRI